MFGSLCAGVLQCVLDLRPSVHIIDNVLILRLEYTVLTPESGAGAPCEHEDGHVIERECRGGSCGKAEL